MVEVLQDRHGPPQGKAALAGFAVCVVRQEEIRTLVREDGQSRVVDIGDKGAVGDGNWFRGVEAVEIDPIVLVVGEGAMIHLDRAVSDVDPPLLAKGKGAVADGLLVLNGYAKLENIASTGRRGSPIDWG